MTVPPDHRKGARHLRAPASPADTHCSAPMPATCHGVATRFDQIQPVAGQIRRLQWRIYRRLAGRARCRHSSLSALAASPAPKRMCRRRRRPRRRPPRSPAGFPAVSSGGGGEGGGGGRGRRRRWAFRPPCRLHKDNVGRCDLLTNYPIRSFNMNNGSSRNTVFWKLRC